MVAAAIEKGFEAFGISEHSHTCVPWDNGNLTEATLPLFFDELRGLKTKYAGELELFCGIEQDALGDLPTTGADYVIGSTHFVQKNGEYHVVDHGEKRQREIAEKHYGGDWYAFAEDYFAAEARVARSTNCDIVGHFDLVNKNNEGGRLFDTANPRYRNAVLEALEEILKTCRLFEINTGAMYRVGRTEQYPQTWVLRELLSRGGEVILSSDSHDIPSIGWKFTEMEDLLRGVGFKYRKTLTKNGFTEVLL
jgi:histidinol-phosphatase (PHP family)